MLKNDMLDKLDRKILYQLDLNARQTDQAIARNVGASREVVAYRIQRLQEQGLVKGFVTILNHNALGLRAYRVFFKLRDFDSEIEKKVVAHLQEKAMWVVRVRGYWSFNTLLLTKDIFALEKLLNDITGTFAASIVDYKVSIITRIYHFRRAYLLEKKQDAGPYELMGAISKPIELDETDKKVLAAIQNDARASTVDLARAIGETERIVRYRIKKLEQAEVILGYRSFLDLPALGYRYYKIHAKLRGQYEKRKLLEFCHRQPNIVYKTESIGGYDLELELQVKNPEDVYVLLDDIQREFPGLLEDFDVMQYDKEYQLSYLNTV